MKPPKKKLIELKHHSLIECDNEQCNYLIPYTEKGNETIHLYIDKPCPLCGENLLTRHDYNQYQKVMEVINFVNKWFSWLTIFESKNAKQKRALVKVHNGITITEKNQPAVFDHKDFECYSPN